MVIWDLDTGIEKSTYSSANILVNCPAVSYKLHIFIIDSATMFPGTVEILTK